ncbi:MAG: hypothetical protein AB1671_13365 [Thermodesulfobacteriota bacterium]
MSRRSRRTQWSLGLLGMLVLTVPPVVCVAEDGRRGRGPVLAQEQFPLGETRDFYRGLLAGLGYTITAIHEAIPGRVEYAVTKEGHTALVRFAMSDATGKATAVAVTSLPPRPHTPVPPLARDTRQAPSAATAIRDETRPAWAGSQADARPARGYRYSDRDRARVDQLATQLEALPLGRDRRFYYTELQDQGYQLVRTAPDTAGHLALEVGKDGQAFALLVRFDAATGESFAFTVSPLWQDPPPTRFVRRHAKPAPESQTASLLLPNGHPAGNGKPLVRGSRYSDRDQARIRQLMQELAALPTGRDRHSYYRMLQSRGYQVVQTEPETTAELALEVGKNGQALALLVHFDATTGQSRTVEVSPLWRESNETEKNQVVSAS